MEKKNNNLKLKISQNIINNDFELLKSAININDNDFSPYFCLSSKNLIGVGGNSCVYYIKNSNKNFFAVKKINLIYTNTDNIIHEVMNQYIANQVLPNHVPLIRKLNYTKTHFYIIMDYYTNFVELYTLIKLNKLNFQLAMEICYEMLLIISYLHCNNLIHCDIKPDNILININLSFGNRLKLIDFGLSSWSSKMNPTYISHSFIKCRQVFTDYCAPELHSSQKCALFSHKIDIYSCGQVFHNIFDQNILYWKNVINHDVLFKFKHVISCMIEHDPLKRISANQAIIDITALF